MDTYAPIQYDVVLDSSAVSILILCADEFVFQVAHSLQVLPPVSQYLAVMQSIPEHVLPRKLEQSNLFLHL